MCARGSAFLLCVGDRVCVSCLCCCRVVAVRLSLCLPTRLSTALFTDGRRVYMFVNTVFSHTGHFIFTVTGHVTTPATKQQTPKHTYRYTQTGLRSTTMRNAAAMDRNGEIGAYTTCQQGSRVSQRSMGDMGHRSHQYHAPPTALWTKALSGLCLSVCFVEMGMCASP